MYSLKEPIKKKTTDKNQANFSNNSNDINYHEIKIVRSMINK